MTPHPNAVALEAFSCGEDDRAVREHVAQCSACAKTVRALEALIGSGSLDDARDKVYAIPTEARETPKREGSVNARWQRTVTIASVLAAAALVVLFLRRTPPPEVAGSSGAPAIGAPGLPEPETTFKGGVQVAVIRERAGQQERFTGTVRVREGDRLRVEVALDRQATLLSAVLGDDASWLELMAAQPRPPGTHFSEHSARVDSSPTRGTILVGTPEAVAHARATRSLDRVSAIRVEWEGP